MDTFSCEIYRHLTQTSNKRLHVGVGDSEKETNCCYIAEYPAHGIITEYRANFPGT